jgi:hypothetical protein
VQEQPIYSEHPQPTDVASAVPYCFCTLAFGAPYRLAARQLAQQLQSLSIPLFVVTDKPQEFNDLTGVTTVKLRRTSILYPYNDKRFALEIALKHHDCAVLVDADSEVSEELPLVLNVPPGMYAEVAQKTLADDLQKYHPRNFPGFQGLATKLGVDLQQAQWVCENLIIIRRDGDREWKFLETWAYADRWLGIRRVFQGDHGYIGLSAAVAGWKVYQHSEFIRLRAMIHHQGHQHIGVASKVWQPSRAITRKVGFYWRMMNAICSTFLEPKKYWL